MNWIDELLDKRRWANYTNADVPYSRIIIRNMERTPTPAPLVAPGIQATQVETLPEMEGNDGQQ
jgi:hypothetical protein